MCGTIRSKELFDVERRLVWRPLEVNERTMSCIPSAMGDYRRYFYSGVI